MEASAFLRNFDLSFLRDAGVTIDRNGSIFFYDKFHIVSDNLNHWTKAASSEEIEKVKDTISQFFTQLSSFSYLIQIPVGSTMPLIRLFINNNELQTKIYQVVCNFIGQTSLLPINPDIHKLIVLLIEGLRFPPVTVEPHLISNSLIEAMTNAADEFKPILIQSLHTIIDVHQELIDKLLEIMIENPSLTKDVLSTLEGFSLCQEDNECVRNCVLRDVLNSAPPKSLSSVISFILNTTDKENVEKTVNAFRQKIFISQGNDGDIDGNENDYSIVIQLKSAFQFSDFLADKFLEVITSAQDFEILDIWVTFILYSIPKYRRKVQIMITKLKDFISPEYLSDSIKNHGKSLEIVINAICYLFSWLIETNDETLNNLGSIIALSLFEEIDDYSVLQDLIGSLLTQIGIGSMFNKKCASDILTEISIEFTSKLNNFTSLLEGILVSLVNSIDDVTNENMFNLYRKLVNINLRTVIQEPKVHIDSSLLLYIMFSKLLNLSKEIMKMAGVISYAAVFCHYGEFEIIDDDEFEPIVNHYTVVMTSIGDQSNLVEMFFNEILQNQKAHDKPMNNKMCEFLSEKLEKELHNIVIDRIEDDESVVYSIGDTEKAIDFRSHLLTVSEPQLNNLSLQQYRNTISTKIWTYVFTQSGIRLYFYVNKILNNHNSSKIVNFLKMPLFLFPINHLIAIDGTFDDNQKITSLIYAHSWVIELINFFSDDEDLVEDCWTRMNHRIHLEGRILGFLRNMDEFTHPIKSFKLKKSQINPIANYADPSAYFIHLNRNVFNKPTLSEMSLFKSVTLPITDDSKRIILRLILDYKYLLTSGLVEEPPFEIIDVISTKILPDAIVKKGEFFEQLAIETIQTIIFQLNLPFYKVKNNCRQLFLYCSHKSTRYEVFKYYFSFANKKLPLKLQMALIHLLRTVLHCGYNKDKCDPDGREYLNIKSLCLTALKTNFDGNIIPSSSSISFLTNQDIKRTISIFFEHQPNLFDVDDIVRTALRKTVDNDNWPCLTAKTYPYMLKYCFQFLIYLFSDYEKKLRPEHLKTLHNNDKESLLAQLIGTTKVIRKIIRFTSRMNPKVNVIKIIIKCGTSLFDCITLNFFKFITAASKIDPVNINILLNKLRHIQQAIQLFVSHAEREKMRITDTILPRAHFVLSKFSYDYKNVASNLMPNEEIVVNVVQNDRNIFGIELYNDPIENEV